jgi:RNA polymerase sigma-70 factor, ECF subfamily
MGAASLSFAAVRREFTPLARPTRLAKVVDFARARRHRSAMEDPPAMTNARAADLLHAVAHRQDTAAFAELFQFLAPRLKGQAMRFGWAPDAAEELAQDTLVAVWRKAAHFDPERGAAIAWIYRINVNLRIDRARRDQRAAEVGAYDAATAAAAGVAPAEDLATANDTMSRAEDADLVAAALVALPGDQRQIVEMSFFEDVPHSEIARRLAIPLGTVKSRVRLALRRLRSGLEAAR